MKQNIEILSSISPTSDKIPPTTGILFGLEGDPHMAITYT